MGDSTVIAAPLIADIGPPDFVFLPFLGAMGIAACLLVVGIVAGGIWFVHGTAAPRSRRVFLIAGMYVSVIASLFLAMMWWFWEEQNVWIGALVFLALAFVFGRTLWLGARTNDMTESEIAHHTTQ